MKPVLIVVMGVSGCGKSSVAKAIAKRLAYTFIEADDFHSAENRAHMQNGKPLTDAMRAPWIQSLRAELLNRLSQGQNCTLSFSGLKAAHRQQIRDLPFPIFTLHLHGSQSLVLERMQNRKGHFMPASLLSSQYQALESTNGETNTAIIDIEQTLDAVVDDALELVIQFLSGDHNETTPADF